MSEKSVFDLIWFGKSLDKSSGIRMWKDPNIIEILGQKPYKLEQPVNWLDDPYSHRSWCWIFNSFQWMDQLLARYKLNPLDNSAIDICANYFIDWICFYIDGERTGEFLWKDDAVSFRTFRISIIANYIFNNVKYDDEIKLKVKSVLNLHYLELIDRKKFKTNNHGIFQMRALISLLTIHPDLGCIKTAKKYAVERLNWLWNRQYGTQNIHLENSTGYHQYIIKEFSEIVRSPEFLNVNFVFSQKDIDEVISNARFFFHPNGVGTLFGDSNFTKQEHDIVVGDHIFNESGYAFFAGNDRSVNNLYLAIRTGFPSVAHRHSDDFSFEWSEKGQIIFQDSGRYSYDYDNPIRKFLTSSKAHNTVSVNGENFPWWGDFKKSDYYSGAIEQFSSSDNNVYLSLFKKFSKGFSFRREFDLVRGDSLTISDFIIPENKGEFIEAEQWFHLAEDFEYKGEDNGELLFQATRLKIVVIPPKDSKILVLKGYKKDYLQGWVSYKEKHLIPRWSLGFIKEGKAVLFETKIFIQD